MPGSIKFALEIIPLLLFFIIYKFYGIIYATIAIMFSSFISIVIHYLIEKKIPKIMLLSNLLVIVLGLVTVFSQNSKFIKMKPTVLYVFFALILWVSALLKKPIIKNIFSGNIYLSDKIWFIFSKRCACFLFFLAMCNEIIWRNFTEDFWVKFKVFGTIPLIILFIFSQYKFLLQNSINKPE